MTAADDYCDFCDLPRSQCIHGQPPPPPRPATTADTRPRPRPRKKATPRARTSGAGGTTSAPARPVNRRWSPPALFKPLILEVLEEAGGELEADEVFLELEIRAEDRFLSGDRERTPQGEPRWQYAARRARLALIDEGLMVKSRPGVWELVRPGGSRS